MQIEEAIRVRLINLIDRASKADCSIISRSLLVTLPCGNSKRLEASILGIRYMINFEDEAPNLHVEDALGMKEDASRLLVYMLNAIERALECKISSSRGALISLTQLPGGQAARLYEKRIVSFLAAEMDGANPSEVEVAVGKIGGAMVKHSNESWSFEVSPFNGVRINASYWQGEENMPSGAALLLGEEVRNIEIPIDELVAIIEITINRFVSFYRKETGKKPRVFQSLYL